MSSVFSKLDFARERAVIINVHTLLCTTLAILSAKRYLPMRLLVVDCPLEGKSDYEALKRLQKEYDFDLLHLPLRQHGDMLDEIFLHIPSEYVYLVDSDVELLREEAYSALRLLRENTFLAEEQVFGMGLRQVSGYGLPPQERMYHAERMWIPYCALRVAAVREVIEKGESFNIVSKSNLSTMGGGLRKVRNRLNRYGMKRLARGLDRIMDSCRYRHQGHGTDAVLYDTGALVYEALVEKGKVYLDINFYAYPAFATHFCGITRQQMYDNEPSCTELNSVARTIRERLKVAYGFDYDTYYRGE